jgi:hypothetical protein
MRAETRRRLERLEARSTDHIAKLDTIDYLPLEDYEESADWIEVEGGDETVTVYWNRKSGEFRGVYRDRRSEDELVEAGGDLAFL